ncbi:DegV family protein [Staphylococcus epidermidis]|nr:DegV family protein [Staphylococcus epidermidis]
MAKQIIVTDSTSDLSHEYLKQHNIHVIPLSLTIDGNLTLIKLISLQVSISIILKMMQTSKQVNHLLVDLLKHMSN